ncbi:hypothetical protein VHEMI07530 [[Torrubiella] hemipterigena]|uniref:2EXR domain-containing protein n=1 Tax=[Torrubiella] hemipterigena TaxID=1531966 RepID=A0A0A1TN35_9HYPO|nr:hypothetical protein VHEMI07530 [[Torrubiella] hemipterigena]
MTNRAEVDTAFPQFPFLPRELRDRVWYFAAPAPADDDPALFFFSYGLVTQYRPELGDFGFDLDFEDMTLFARFCHEDLDAVPVRLALSQVNKEARDTVLRSAYHLGYETFKTNSSGALILGRRMRPTKDVLFIRDDDHRVFLEEVWDKFVDTEACFSDYPGPRIWGLNSSELLSCPEYPESIVHDQPSVERVYIFASPDIEKTRSSHNGLQERRISVKQDNGRSWVCSEDGKTWSWGLGDKVGTDQLNDLVQRCTVNMSDLYVSKWGTEFSIRIVEAVCN